MYALMYTYTFELKLMVFIVIGDALSGSLSNSEFYKKYNTYYIVTFL